MTRQEEVEACIINLKYRIPINANAITEYVYDKNNETLKDCCKYLIENLEDLLGYLKELEELK